MCVHGHVVNSYNSMVRYASEEILERRYNYYRYTTIHYRQYLHRVNVIYISFVMENL